MKTHCKQIEMKNNIKETVKLLNFGISFILLFTLTGCLYQKNHERI